MNNKRQAIRLLFNILAGAVVLLGVLVTSLIAQQRDPNRGIQFGSAYAAGNFDAVNVNNGNVIINLPLGSLPAGRGTSPGFTVTLQYNSKLWDSKETNYSNHLQQGGGDPNNTGGDYFYTANRLQPSDRGGWKVLSSYQLIETNRIDLATPDPCNGGSIDDHNARWKLEMEFPDGSVKQFIPVYYGTKTKDGYYNVNASGVTLNYATLTNPAGICYVGGSSAQATTNGMTYMTTDGSRLRLFVPYHSTQLVSQRNWKLYSSEGALIENAPPDDTTVSQRVTERNGNKIEIKGNVIVDQLGRSITISGSGVTVSGVGGESVTTQIVGGYRWVHQRYKAIAQFETVPNGTERYAEFSEQILTVEQVIMPTQAGGQSYNFEYNADAVQQYGTNYTNGWGELKSVTLPSGAKSTYTYDWPTGEYVVAADILGSHVTQRDMTFTEDYDGAQTPRTETTYYNTSQVAASVTQPNGATSVEHQVFYSFGQLWDSGLSLRTNNPDGSFVERLWKDNLPN